MAFARTMLAVVAILGLTTSAFANEFAHHDVVELTTGNFADKVNDGGVWFIKFYAPWCGHCKRLAPTWGELGQAFKGEDKIHVAHIDCTTSKETCSQYEVKGYPTLKVLVNGSEFRQFKGPRTLEGLSSYLQEAAKDALGETVA